MRHYLKILFFFGLISVVQSGFAQSPNAAACPANKSLDIVSINIGFGYNYNSISEGLGLNYGPSADRDFYAEMAKGFTPQSKIYSLGDLSAPEGTTKKEFLAKLKDIVRGSKYVNFNYAGHGEILRKREFGILLPSVPASVLKSCLGWSPTSSGSRGGDRINGAKLDGSPIPKIESSARPEPVLATVAPLCPELEPYYITTSDLKEVFEDRKVFGIIDACYAGSLSLGPNSSMLLAAEGLAHQNDYAGGAFTRTVRSALEDRCNYDLDGDQQISMNELTTVLKTKSMEKYLPKGMKQTPILSNAEWTNCFIPSPVSPTQQVECTRSFNSGEVAVLTAPAEALSLDSSKRCYLKSGTDLQVAETKSASSGRVKVETPSVCGFNDGTVAIKLLRSKKTDPVIKASVSPMPVVSGPTEAEK